MTRISPLAALGLLLSALSACASDGLTSLDEPGFTSGGQGGEAGQNGNTGGTKAAGAAGATGYPEGAGGTAGTGQGGASGQAGGPVAAPPSLECQACVRSLCVDCPGGDAACEPCSADAGLCDGSRGAAWVCACESGCAAACAAAWFCAPDSDGGVGGSGTGEAGAGSGGAGGAGVAVELCDNGVDDDGDGAVDCDSPRCKDVCARPCAAARYVPVAAAEQTLAGLWKGHADEQTPFCALSAQSGPEVVYLVESQAKGFLRASVASASDAMLSVRTSCEGVDLVCRNDTGVGGGEQLVLPVEAGKPVLVVVGAASAGEAGGFALSLQVQVSDCGDGVVTPDEQCDPGPGPSDTCEKCELKACQGAQAVADDGQTVPSGGAVETSVLQPSCVPLGQVAPEHIHAVRASHTGRLQAVLRSLEGNDLTLSVRTSCQGGAELGCVDEAPGAEGATERLVVPSVEGQTFFLVVERYGGGEPGPYEMWVRSAPLGCGDGALGVSEQCEPGLVEGCTGQCTAALPAGPGELEPNNQPPQATPLADGVWGAIVPAGDVDLYRVDVPGPGLLEATVSDPGDGSCAASGQPGGLLDSELRLRALDGSLVARDDNAPGHGVCSQLRRSVAAGAYLLEVRASSSSPEQVFSYRLDTSWAPSTP